MPRKVPSVFANTKEGNLIEWAIPVTAGDGDGVTEANANPFGQQFTIIQGQLVISTASTGACTLDIGTAADATTSSDNLNDGLSAAATGSFDIGSGTNGRKRAVLAADGYLNIAEASGDITGLVGTLYLYGMLTGN